MNKAVILELAGNIIDQASSDKDPIMDMGERADFYGECLDEILTLALAIRDEVNDE